MPVGSFSLLHRVAASVPASHNGLAAVESACLGAGNSLGG